MDLLALMKKSRFFRGFSVQKRSKKVKRGILGGILSERFRIVLCISHPVDAHFSHCPQLRQRSGVNGVIISLYPLLTLCATGAGGRDEKVCVFLRV